MTGVFRAFALQEVWILSLEVALKSMKLTSHHLWLKYLILIFAEYSETPF
jgi:hypothetical protein